MQTNVSIERCANCGHYLDNNEYIRLPNKSNIGWSWGFPDRIVGYCCTNCRYTEEI